MRLFPAVGVAVFCALCIACLLYTSRRRSQELTHQVRTLRDRTAKKLAIQQSDLLRCADRAALRQKADLIKARCV